MASASISRPGARVVNIPLADTLSLIAREGADTLYGGTLGSHLVAEIKAKSGILSLEDLMDCKAEQDAPLDVPYRGRHVSTPPTPGGGLYVAQILRLLEQFDLVAIPHNSPEYIRSLAKARRIAGRDKDRYVSAPASSRFRPNGCGTILRCGRRRSIEGTFVASCRSTQVPSTSLTAHSRSAPMPGHIANRLSCRPGGMTGPGGAVPSAIIPQAGAGS